LDVLEVDLHRHLIALAACLWMASLSACVTVPFQDTISGNGKIGITAWARLRGEFMIYGEAASMNRQLEFPHCISGVFSNQAEIMKILFKFDGKLVTLTGELFNYSDLPDENRPILQRKMLSDSLYSMHAEARRFC
jgi:hypothetical protein